MAQSHFLSLKDWSREEIELLFEDDTGKPDVGRSGVEKPISREKVPDTTGGYSSSVTSPAAPEALVFSESETVRSVAADSATGPPSAPGPLLA